MQTVIETPDYLADVKAAKVSAEEQDAIVAFVAANPKAGDVIVGTGGVRKVRIAGKGKGKSGGYRVITCFGGDDVPVFLLLLLSKGERASLTDAEKHVLKSEVAAIARDYRAAMRK